MHIHIEGIDCSWSSCPIFLDLLKSAGGSCSVALCFRSSFWTWKAMLQPAQVSMPCESFISKAGIVSRIQSSGLFLTWIWNFHFASANLISIAVSWSLYSSFRNLSFKPEKCKGHCSHTSCTFTGGRAVKKHFKLGRRVTQKNSIMGIT